MAYFFDNLKNNFDFFIRNYLSFSRKNYFEKEEELKNIKTFGLEDKFDLDLLCLSTKYNFKLNLYFLNVFDKFLSKKENDNISILDIGSKNWEYAKSEYIFFNSFNNNFVLDGIELDYNRLNYRFYSRFEVAKFYIKNLKNVNYIKGDLLKHNKKYDYIIWILPFITEYPLVKWGLPLRYFKPKEMLSYAYNLLNKNGEMFIINQGVKEYIIQKELFECLNLKAEYFGEIEDKYNLFNNKRFCSKIIKIN